MILIVILLIVVGISIKYGKMYYLIAGFSPMSRVSKRKYDMEAIASLLGNVLFAMALIISIGYFAALWFGEPRIEMLSLNLAIFFGMLYLLIRGNSRKYRIDNNIKE